jgi:hypothetical protein
LFAAACCAALAALPLQSARAQQGELRTQLTARGLPADLVDGVAAVAADAAARGLPTAPLADKALEGWAKRVPSARIVSVVQQFAGRMVEARDAVRTAGAATPSGDVVAAAAEAMNRGMSAAQVGDVVRAAPASPSAAPSLRVAAALSAQGMQMEQAVSVVARAMHDGRAVEQILDLPSTMRAWQAQGMAPPEIGRRMLAGAPGGSGMRGPGGLRPEGAPGGPGAGPPPGRPVPPRIGPGAGRPPTRMPPRPTSFAP